MEDMRYNLGLLTYPDSITQTPAVVMGAVDTALGPTTRSTGLTAHPEHRYPSFSAAGTARFSSTIS